MIIHKEAIDAVHPELSPNWTTLTRQISEKETLYEKIKLTDVLLLGLLIIYLILLITNLYYLINSALFSLLSIVSDDDISVGFRPLRALLVGERIVQFEI